MTKILNLKLVIFLEISRYENIFSKGFIPNCPEDVFVIKEVKHNVRWRYVIHDLNREEKFLKHFTKKNCENQINIYIYIIEKVMKRNVDKLYVK